MGYFPRSFKSSNTTNDFVVDTSKMQHHADYAPNRPQFGYNPAPKTSPSTNMRVRQALKNIGSSSGF